MSIKYRIKTAVNKIFKRKNKINTIKELNEYVREKKIIGQAEIKKLYLELLENRGFLQHYTNLKFLAREAVITEMFVNRLRRQTSRPIVVLGISRTGVPYTWSIKPTRGLVVDKLYYPSSYIEEKLVDVQKKVLAKLKKYRRIRPLFVFVDASSSQRMPSSFVGSNYYHFINEKQSLNTLLKANGYKTKVIGYDWSMKDSSKYLPKDIALEKLNAILFNPSKRSQPREFLGEKKEYSSAPHDDKTDYIYSEFFEELVKDLCAKEKRRYS